MQGPITDASNTRALFPAIVSCTFARIILFACDAASITRWSSEKIVGCESARSSSSTSLSSVATARSTSCITTSVLICVPYFSFTILNIFASSSNATVAFTGASVFSFAASIA